MQKLLASQYMLVMYRKEFTVAVQLLAGVKGSMAFAADPG
jgi:hypothetical protein